MTARAMGIVVSFSVCMGTAHAVAHAQQAPRAAEKTTKTRPSYAVETNEELQSAVLPTLPVGMTIEMLVRGDELFHGRAGCFACHGAEAQGLPAAGDGITTALFYARHEWASIDSLIRVGIPDAITRSPIAMPARGARGDLTQEETQRLAAYVWAISVVRGEPWPGGHATHAGMAPPGSTKGTAPSRPTARERTP
jgi:mono/diheme cytochrome c family protein